MNNLFASLLSVLSELHLYGLLYLNERRGHQQKEPGVPVKAAQVQAQYRAVSAAQAAVPGAFTLATTRSY